MFFALLYFQEEAYLQEAIKNSLQETTAAKASGETPRISDAGQSLLLDFLEEEPPAPSGGSMPYVTDLVSI